MHPHLTAVFQRLDDVRAQLRQEIAVIPASQQQTRPAPDRWSASEIVHHLSLVERRFTKSLGEAIAEARAKGLGEERGERAPWPEHIAALVTDRVARREAPEPVRPETSIDRASAWAALESARAEFKSTIGVADGLALSEVTYAHPFFGAMTMYQWVEHIAGHEARHVAQIREIAESLPPVAHEGQTPGSDPGV